MGNNKAEFLKDVAEYYTEKLSQHGMVPRGVDWNGAESQMLRFQQLCKIIKPSEEISLNDLGCGYGALYAFLATEYARVSYAGIDVSESMIQAAQQRYHGVPQVRFIHSSKPDQMADYGIASGIFNVRLGRSNAEWQDYLTDALDMLDQTSRVGFSFNCLTLYSDADRMRDYLYYADPCILFDLCKRRYARNVALLHDYGLYEFTILVRKQA
ncbi:MAG: class I SAM-dependent methyltransferase [Magnetococcales bacterium]|nr:class I SAM-dependent methyltransferase [Magnetococcales bacterium]